MADNPYDEWEQGRTELPSPAAIVKWLEPGNEPLPAEIEQLCRAIQVLAIRVMHLEHLRKADPRDIDEQAQ